MPSLAFVEIICCKKKYQQFHLEVAGHQKKADIESAHPPPVRFLSLWPRLPNMAPFDRNHRMLNHFQHNRDHLGKRISVHDTGGPAGLQTAGIRRYGDNLKPTGPNAPMGPKDYIEMASKLILASKSPRRKYLLRQAGIDFDVIPSNFDERSIEMTDPGQYVRSLSAAKAHDVARHYPGRWIIGADTIVLIDGQILGKPKGKEAARQMLHQLSGQTHQVYTGFTITCTDRTKCFTDAVCTDVTFKKLSPTEIEWYIQTDEPFDKAGAYAIQGLGTFLVKSISGSYTNVVGLPVCEVIEHLIREGVIRLNHSDQNR